MAVVLGSGEEGNPAGVAILVVGAGVSVLVEAVHEDAAVVNLSNHQKNTSKGCPIWS